MCTLCTATPQHATCIPFCLHKPLSNLCLWIQAFVLVPATWIDTFAGWWLKAVRNSESCSNNTNCFAFAMAFVRSMLSSFFASQRNLASPEEPSCDCTRPGSWWRKNKRRSDWRDCRKRASGPTSNRKPVWHSERGIPMHAQDLLVDSAEVLVIDKASFLIMLVAGASPSNFGWCRRFSVQETFFRAASMLAWTIVDIYFMNLKLMTLPHMHFAQPGLNLHLISSPLAFSSSASFGGLYL